MLNVAICYTATEQWHFTIDYTDNFARTTGPRYSTHLS